MNHPVVSCFFTCIPASRFATEDKAHQELTVKHREGRKTCQLVTDGRIYDIDFTKMVQVNRQTQKTRKIRCFFNLPPHWGISDDDALKSQANGHDWMGPTNHIDAVTDKCLLGKLNNLLNRSLHRHDGQRCTCPHGDSRFQLLEAYQVRNLPLWRAQQWYAQNIRDKHKRYGSNPKAIEPSVGQELRRFAAEIEVDLDGNELLLFHGTTSFDVAKRIANMGFDHLCGDGGFYGYGTYFAAQTCKSAQYAHARSRHEKASRHKPGTIIVARVAVGDPFYTPRTCLTSRGAVAPFSTSFFFGGCGSVGPGVFYWFPGKMSHLSWPVCY